MMAFFACGGEVIYDPATRSCTGAFYGVRAERVFYARKAGQASKQPFESKKNARTAENEEKTFM